MQKQLLIILFACLALPCLAWDESQPIAPREVGWSFSAYQEFASSPWAPNLDGKVGLVSGLDLEYSQPISLDGNVQGLGQPNLGLKWAVPQIESVALLAAVQIPIGFHSVVGPTPATAIDLALVYEQAIAMVSITGFAGYTFDVQTPGDGEIRFYADPYLPLGAGFSAYLGLNASKPLTSVGPSFGVWPGVNYEISEAVGICADLDVDFYPGVDPIYGMTVALYGSL